MLRTSYAVNPTDLSGRDQRNHHSASTMGTAIWSEALSPNGPPSKMRSGEAFEAAEKTRGQGSLTNGNDLHGLPKRVTGIKTRRALDQCGRQYTGTGQPQHAPRDEASGSATPYPQPASSSLRSVYAHQYASPSVSSPVAFHWLKTSPKYSSHASACNSLSSRLRPPIP